MKPQTATIAISQAASERAPSTTAFRTFVAIVLAHCVLDCYGGAWPIFKKLAGLDLGWAGILATVTTVFTMSLQPLFGIWADQGRRRLFILLGTLMAITGMSLGPIGYHIGSLGPTTAYLLMLLVLLIVRIGQAMFHPAGASVTGSTAGDRRSTFVAVFIAGGMLGFASSHILFATTYKHLDGATHWLMLPALVIWVGLLFTIRPKDESTGEKPRFRDLLHSVSLLRTRMWTLFGVQVMISAQAMGTYFLLPEFLESRGCPTWLSDGGGFGLMVGGSVLMMVPAGQLADKFGRRKLLVLVLALSLVCYYFMVTAQTLPLLSWCALLLVTGGLIGTANPLGVAIGQHLLPNKASLVSGVLMGLAWALGGMAQSIVGSLAEIPAFGIDGALWWLGVTNIISLVLALVIPKTLTIKSNDE